MCLIISMTWRMFFRYGFLSPTQDQMSQSHQGEVRESVHVFGYTCVISHGGMACVCVCA